MRSRHESISSLGRAPSRVPRRPVTPLPPVPPPPETGGIRRWIHGALFDNLALKFLSLVLAITVFLLVNTDRDSELTARVRVLRTPPPPDKVLVSDLPPDVTVTIKGSWRRLREFDERDLQPIDLDLRDAASGDITITNDMIHTDRGHLPMGLSIASIEPRTIHLVFERKVQKVVAVNPTVTGHPSHGYLVTGVRAEPPTIIVRGAEGTLSALSAIQTHEVSVENRSASFVEETDPAPPDGVELVGTPKIVLHVSIDEELVTRNFPGIAVAVRGDGIDPAKWQVQPGQVDVTLTGALLAVEKARDAMVPVVKPGPADGKAHEADVTIEGLPPGIGVKLSPERVKLVPVVPNHP
jgi:YbbR domain-containing protein